MDSAINFRIYQTNPNLSIKDKLNHTKQNNPVPTDDEAMAEPQPKVLKQASTI